MTVTQVIPATMTIPSTRSMDYNTNSASFQYALVASSEGKPRDQKNASSFSFLTFLYCSYRAQKCSYSSNSIPIFAYRSAASDFFTYKSLSCGSVDMSLQ